MRAPRGALSRPRTIAVTLCPQLNCFYANLLPTPHTAVRVKLAKWRMRPPVFCDFRHAPGICAARKASPCKGGHFSLPDVGRTSGTRVSSRPLCGIPIARYVPLRDNDMPEASESMVKEDPQLLVSVSLSHLSIGISYLNTSYLSFYLRARPPVNHPKRHPNMDAMH